MEPFDDYWVGINIVSGWYVHMCIGIEPNDSDFDYTPKKNIKVATINICMNFPQYKLPSQY